MSLRHLNGQRDACTANHRRLAVCAHRPPRPLQNDQGGLAGLEHARGHCSTGSSAWIRPRRTVRLAPTLAEGRQRSSWGIVDSSTFTGNTSFP